MEVEREAAETTAAVARIGDGIEAARESASETASKTGAVLELNDLIGNVADRTRILAMDAAIEAAHAGDHGKGFAVVPDEIRNLAEEASTRAAETATGLRGIQEATLRLTEASDPVGLAFSGIDESVEHTDSALQSIAGRMSAQRSGAEEAAGIEAGARRAEESARRNTMGASALEAGLAHYVTELPQETGSIAQEA
jgi:methyl-accepting chemotaxis protein